MQDESLDCTYLHIESLCRVLSTKPSHTAAPLTVSTLPLSGKKGDTVFDTYASDPDLPAQTLSFSLSVFPSDGLFTIDTLSGVIRLTEDIPLNTAQSTYYLTVTVTDSGSPALADVSTFEVNLVTAVDILGDTEAIERGTDNIVLKARRYSFDNSVPLTVYYDLSWNGKAPTNSFYRPIVTANADASDIESTDLTNFLNDASGTFGSVTIPANDIMADLPVLRAVFDNLNPNGDVGEIENFLARILLDPTNAGSYVGIDDAPDDAKKAYMEALGEQELIIVDGVQLFSPDNAESTLADNPGLAAGNPGIHFNDVRQGQVGDCWFLSAVMQLARIDPTKLQRLFHDNGDGTFQVALYETGIVYNGWVWKTYSADELLTRGRNGTKLSGDMDLGGVEIWPNLLERRLADYHSTFGGGEAVGDAWKMLTGATPTVHSTSGKTAIQIYESIKTAHDAGKGVIVATPVLFPNGTNTMDVNNNQQDYRIRADHTYLVDDIPIGGINLINPWGHSHVRPLQWGFCDDVIVEWYEFSNPTTSGPSAP